MIALPLVLAVTTGCDPEATGGRPVSFSPAPKGSTAKPQKAEIAKPEKPKQPKSTPTPTPTPTYSTPKPRPSTPAPVLTVGNEGEAVRDVQARLLQLGLFQRNPTGYYGTVTRDAVSAFQKQRGTARTGSVSAADRTALNSRTRQPTQLERYPTTTLPPAKPDSRCRTGRVLCVSKKSRTLLWMKDGQVLSAMDVRFGSAYTPTREGAFKVDFKSRNHHSTIYDTPMPYAMFFSGGQAVHYSADFAARGYSGASHGCVNVRDRKRLAKVFNEVRAGDRVVVYN
ncbi:L,D-transpeptidase family protein [Streptomyces sp. NPDC005438]|uniref:L,D-transpeptidase family protein n=1 Tax=Streptomyces sp. NPDC005438 TaxID=3156880 RepID=UPI0033B02747